MDNKLEKKRFSEALSDYSIIVALFALVILISIISPEFRTMSNFMNLLRQSSINGFLAFGMTCVILTGGIDLSVGSVLALTGAFCAGFLAAGIPVPVALLLAIVIGTVIGVINGLLITAGKLQPFIATLITQIVFRGFTMIYTGGRPISNLGDSKFFYAIGNGTILGVPVPAIMFVVAFAVMWFALEKTTYGRKLYATGSNESAAKLAGVNIDKTKIIAYAICAILSTIAGIILLSKLDSAQPLAGSGYELDAIAAVALGGTSMSGGKGRIWGTFVAVLIIAVLNNGLNILGVSSYWQEVVKGVVILVAVIIDRKKQ